MKHRWRLRRAWRAPRGLDWRLMSTTLVLAVDDEPALLKITERTLQRGGYAVLTFDDPRDALAEMVEGLRPDVIVSDIHMPVIDGYEFYRKVRDLPELRAVPFLFLTALEDRASMRKGMALGADDYLTKPFRAEELLDAVEVRLKRIAELRTPARGRGRGHRVRASARPPRRRAPRLGVAQGARAALLPARAPRRRDHLRGRRGAVARQDRVQGVVFVPHHALPAAQGDGRRDRGVGEPALLPAGQVHDRVRRRSVPGARQARPRIADRQRLPRGRRAVHGALPDRHDRDVARGRREPRCRPNTWPCCTPRPRRPATRATSTPPPRSTSA